MLLRLVDPGPAGLSRTIAGFELATQREMPWQVNVAAPQPIPLTTIFSGEEQDSSEHELQRTPSAISRHGHNILEWRSQRRGWDHWWPLRSSRRDRRGASKDSDGSDEESVDCKARLTGDDHVALCKQHTLHDTPCVQRGVQAAALTIATCASLLMGIWLLWRMRECGLRRACLFA